MKTREPDIRFRPLPARRRLLILLLAIATAITIALLLLHPPGGVKRTRPKIPACSEARQTECVGGKADVILLPPSDPASR